MIKTIHFSVSDRIGRLFEITGLKDLMHVNEANGGRITCNLKKILSKCAASIGRVCRFNSFNTFWRFFESWKAYMILKMEVQLVAVTNAVKHGIQRK